MHDRIAHRLLVLREDECSIGSLDRRTLEIGICSYRRSSLGVIRLVLHSDKPRQEFSTKILFLFKQDSMSTDEINHPCEGWGSNLQASTKDRVHTNDLC